MAARKRRVSQSVDIKKEKVMDSNEERVQKHVVVNTPGQRSEVLTERTERGPRESRLSVGTIAIVAIPLLQPNVIDWTWPASPHG